MSSRKPEREELERIYLFFEDERNWRVYQEIKDYFHTLYTRSQLFFGLITITLTITGFSGPTIASSNIFSRLFLGIGIFLVLLSAVTFALGPLRINWISQIRETSVDAILEKALERRNSRTAFYRASVIILTVGLLCYVGSLIAFLVVGS